ncbi:hypothetical protein BT96DRAFT_1009097 [Gymnopus androsaceus JB14]|uniref:Uncharacterized protein n=1 Tax=Gymnopus androsaceus JB14 TaxID=1447944 RepID=A0A6A4GD76_9AGAR|nr:hypothetical protein BT96DRAFT_1009097 [Gymnopus androsaceus JB14]
MGTFKCTWIAPFLYLQLLVNLIKLVFLVIVVFGNVTGSRAFSFLGNAAGPGASSLGNMGGSGAFVFSAEAVVTTSEEPDFKEEPFNGLADGFAEPFDFVLFLAI